MFELNRMFNNILESSAYFRHQLSLLSKYLIHSTETIVQLGARDFYASVCRHIHLHVNRHALIGCNNAHSLSTHMHLKQIDGRD